MKIFLSFLQGRPDHPIPAYQFWEYYIKNGIEENGDQWIENDVDWAYGLTTLSKEAIAEWKSAAWEKTIATIKQEKPELFLSYLYPHQIEPSVIQQINALGIPTVNFFCDNVREFKKAPEAFKDFSLNWVPEYKALKMYKDAGYKYLHLPMPMWVEPKYRVINVEANNVVTFIGSKDVQRQMLFEEVIKHHPSFELEIYGAAWKETDSNTVSSKQEQMSLHKKLSNQVDELMRHGILSYYRKFRHRNFEVPLSSALSSCLKGRPSFDEYVKLTSQSLVTLGINRYPSSRVSFMKPDSYSRLRDIEAPMLGACYLTEWTEGLDKYYDIGTEIETYVSAGELVEEAQRFIKDENKRKQFRKAGQQRALHHLSVPHSLQQIKKFFH